MKPPELNTTLPCEELLYILDYYYDIKGPDPITYQEIEAWSRLTNTPLAPWEVRLLRKVDLTASTT